MIEDPRKMEVVAPASAMWPCHIVWWLKLLGTLISSSTKRSNNTCPGYWMPGGKGIIMKVKLFWAYLYLVSIRRPWGLIISIDWGVSWWKNQALAWGHRDLGLNSYFGPNWPCVILGEALNISGPQFHMWNVTMPIKYVANLYNYLYFY
jgi:hypothetical protein